MPDNLPATTPREKNGSGPRRAPGRGSQVTPVERREIQRLFLAEGLTRAAIAAQTGRTRETIANVLAGEDFEQLKADLQRDLAEEARGILRAHVVKAAKAWPRAVEKAADRGDHKPAKDLLLHTDVIAPLGDVGGGSHVTVIVGMPGHPAMPIPTQAEIEAALAARDAGKIRNVAITVVASEVSSE